MQLTTVTPAQIDAEIARLQSEIALRDVAIERADKALKNPHLTATNYDRAKRIIADAITDITALTEELAPLTREFTRRGGWARYYLVEGGHLHYDVSGSRCSRISTTSHYWLTEQSGKSADEVIELAGERVCTVCFPQAPVAVQERPSQLRTKTEAEKAKAREERDQAARDAAARKASKAITAPDGSDLVLVTWGSKEIIKTEASAQSHYREAASTLLLLADERNQKFRAAHQSQAEFDAQVERQRENALSVIAQMLPALAAKHGVTVEDERASHVKAVGAKARKDMRESLQMRLVNIHFYADQSRD